MAIVFPAALDVFTNPLPTDSRTGHAAQHGDLNDAVEALEAIVGTTTSPGLARLNGVAGGQALIGGTLAGETLTLQSTGHATKGKILFGSWSGYDEANVRLGIGTATPGARIHAFSTTEQLRLAYDAFNYLSTTVGSTGEATLAATGGTVTLQGTVATDGPTLGSELLGTAGWTVPAGWTESPDDVFTHTNGGGTNALTHSATITNGLRYQVSWVMTGRTTGSVTVSLGGQASVASVASGSFGPTATSTASLTITPTNDFDGVLSVVSCKSITAISKALLNAKTSGALVAYETRLVPDQTSVAIGVAALRYQTTGISNTALGFFALPYVTTGQQNTALGVSTLQALTTGMRNVAVGQSSLAAAITGLDNTSIGYGALLNLTSGNANVALGMSCGRYQADGVTALTTANNSVFIGWQARGFSNSDSYSIVIGPNAVGLGANTTVLGTINQTTAATIYGACTHSLTDATTNSAVTVETLTKNVTGAGVGAAGLGPRLVFAAESSTTADTSQADITATWTDATHATRKTRLAFSAWDSVAAREGLRIEADGSVARLGFFGATAVVKPTALTAQLTTLTYTAPGTPDYAIADLTQTTPFGFTTADEGRTVLSVIKNLQDRVAQLESKLQALGLLT